jgi:rubrerythrin
MAETSTLDILKGAILLEYRGRALYRSVVDSSSSKEVRELFDMLQKEEDKHIDVLTKQFARISKGESFDVSDLKDEHTSIQDAVLTESILKDITGAGYEAAVIAAALEFEKNSVKYYSDRVSSSESETERKLYSWLAEWEKGHMLMLAKLDNELKEKIWYDNQFWPLD